MRKTASGIVFAVVLVGMLTLTFGIQPAKAEPKTIIVPDDYDKIQGAISNASDGDTILVRAQTYHENIVVDKMVNIQSISGPSVTKVVAYNASDHVFHVTANCVNISGFTVMGAIGPSPTYPGTSGMALDDTNYCNISNNILISNNFGIYLNKAVNNIISGNIAWNNSFGFYLYLTTMKTGYCIIKNNTANSSRYDGFYLYASLYQNITLIKNTANWNERHGIHLQQCYWETVASNAVNENNGSGICLFDDCQYNTLTTNEISSNKCGIRIVTSSNNKLCHNNLINNTDQAYIDEYSNNTWDNGCEGNYWSNYNGTDLDDDGIGDTYIPWEGVDYYPLMNRYWNPGDVDHDLDVDLYDAVRLLKAYGSKLGNEEFNCHCDIAEPYGQIDLYDAVQLLVDYGKKWSD